jgi:hypothetical protein
MGEFGVDGVLAQEELKDIEDSNFHALQSGLDNHEGPPVGHSSIPACCGA